MVSVPVAMNTVTARLVTQSAEALRGLNYDKQNWQSIFSGTGMLLSGFRMAVLLPACVGWNCQHSVKKAASGENSDITGLSGLTTPLSTGQGNGKK